MRIAGSSLPTLAEVSSSNASHALAGKSGGFRVIIVLRAGDRAKALREREGASQAVFARYLNVTTGLVSQWERGEKHPQGASLKLLSLVARDGLAAVA